MTISDVVLVQSPYVPPPPPPDPGWTGLTMLWTGWDGSTWDLDAPTNGIALKRGVEGLGAPSEEHYFDESPAVAGSYWRGYRTKQREAFWPLRLFHDGSTLEWILRDQKFSRTMHPGREGVWTVRSPFGERRLRLRYVAGLDGATEMDPTFFGWVDYGIKFVAAQPFWEGDPVKETWATADTEPFLELDGSRPPFLARAASLDGATLTNPGDEPAYPLWTLRGPFTAASVSVSGQSIGVPFAVTAGQELTIDTRPTELIAMLDGVDVTADLSAFNFAPIEAGDDVPVTITMTGDGSVAVELTPLYRKAW